MLSAAEGVWQVSRCRKCLQDVPAPTILTEGLRKLRIMTSIACGPKTHTTGAMAETRQRRNREEGKGRFS